MRLRDRVAIVTGAQQGIGEAIARAFLAEGASVVVNHLDDTPAIADDRAVAVQADVSAPGDAAVLVEAARDLGGVDLLVNNAGIFPRSSFLDLTTEEWDRVLDVNLKGAFLCTQAVARDMVDRSVDGAVINISSTVAQIGSASGAHYTASKAGLLGLTRASALALAPHGIRVNAIACGLVDTAQPRQDLSEDQLEAIVSGIPLGRLIAPAEIAATAVFLARDEATPITGQAIHVNGGAYLG